MYDIKINGYIDNKLIHTCTASGTETDVKRQIAKLQKYVASRPYAKVRIDIENLTTDSKITLKNY